MKASKIPCLVVNRFGPGGDGKGPRSYRRLGTLADLDVPRITCSDFVARKYVPNYHVIPFTTFEAAASAVETGKAETFLVPGAYREVAKFIQSDRFRLLKVFVVPIPPLVFAGLPTAMPPETSTLFYQPATESLLSEVVSVAEIQHPVTSNAVACRAALGSGGTATAITNQPCAKYFGLTIYKVLRPSQTMPFYLFAAAKTT